MRLTTFTLIALLSSALILTQGCGRSLKQRLEQAEGDADREQQAAEQAERDVLWDYPDEWPAFQSKVEAQIAANEKHISDLKTRAATDDRLQTGVSITLDKLIQRNQELKLRLDRYKDEGKLNWDAFKRDFSHDLAVLETDLRNLDTTAHL